MVQGLTMVRGTIHGDSSSCKDIGSLAKIILKNKTKIFKENTKLPESSLSPLLSSVTVVNLLRKNRGSSERCLFRGHCINIYIRTENTEEIELNSAFRAIYHQKDW
eukprot:TRINITY_DN12620_c2_g1_i1.p1 TRINITY_DN12620_c2_g1~~TRINITY_DN12620_c2_g1_i1.p1  ORF type:complete len:106 (+),score=5.28 TRINITY_DN12620_c2_g1_i1:1379-1696(+)